MLARKKQGGKPYSTSEGTSVVYLGCPGRIPFTYISAANGQGVDSADLVKASHITSVRVRFIPEVTQSASGKITTRSLVDPNISWEEWAGKGSSGDEEGGGEVPDPSL